MTFGLIKSIIEENLLESYKDEKSFKKSINEFKHNILNNKNLSKLYSLYDDLSSPQGLTDDDAKDYLSEGVSSIRNILPKVKLPKVIGESSTSNKYKLIDDIVYDNSSISLSEKVNLKKQLVKKLKESPKVNESIISIPISSMVKIANQTVQSYIESLDETSKKEFLDIVKEDTNELETKFNSLKQIALEKLSPIMNQESDTETKKRLEETISKINDDRFTQINFFRLKKLTESL
jgi:hypothetical protein